MRRLTTLLMTLMLMSTALWADETVTVSANSSDISEGLDLKVVAKLFAEAKNLEEFETMLNNPDSAFCNLDLNGDGQIDYLRVVETGEGSKRLIVLQAVLAKDIYQDVASIYVEKNEKDEVSVQIVGDEYVYGTNYIIEPVYVYRPVIYDWFWCDAWYAWHSPWYWGFWPGWWYAHTCWARDIYWSHCYAYHHRHHCCSFRHGREARRGYHELRSGVTRRDYAASHPEKTFTARNAGRTNASEIRSGSAARSSVSARSAASTESRTYGSRNTASARSAGTVSARAAGTSGAATRSSGTATATRSSSASTTRSSSASTTRSSSASTTRSSSATATRSSSASATRSSGTSTASRSSGSYSGSSSRSSSSYGSSSRSSSSYGSSTRSSSSYGGSSYSGSSSRGGYSGGGYSGGGSRGGGFSGGGGSRGGGGGGSTRR